MDTISRKSVVRAIEALGLDPAMTNRVTFSPGQPITSEQFLQTESSEDGWAKRTAFLAHLGYRSIDVVAVDLQVGEVRVVVRDRDEHGKSIGTHGEVCNVA